MSAKPTPSQRHTNNSRISPPKPTRPRRECDYIVLPTADRSQQSLLPPAAQTRHSLSTERLSSGQLPKRAPRSSDTNNPSVLTTGRYDSDSSPQRPPRRADNDSCPHRQRAHNDTYPERPSRAADRPAVSSHARTMDASQNTGYSSDGSSQASGPSPAVRRSLTLQSTHPTDGQSIPTYGTKQNQSEKRARVPTSSTREATQRKDTLSPHKQYQPYR